MIGKEEIMQKCKYFGGFPKEWSNTVIDCDFTYVAEEKKVLDYINWILKNEKNIENNLEISVKQEDLYNEIIFFRNMEEKDTNELDIIIKDYEYIDSSEIDKVEGIIDQINENLEEKNIPCSIDMDGMEKIEVYCGIEYKNIDVENIPELEELANYTQTYLKKKATEIMDEFFEIY